MTKEARTQWHPAFCAAMSLELNDYEVHEMYQGIYYVKKLGSFPIQVLVSGELSVENQRRE